MSNSKKSDNLRFAIFFIGAKSGQHFLQSFRVLCAMFRSISVVVEANFLVFDLSCAIFAIEDGERVDVAVGQKKKRRPLCQVNLKVNDAVAERIRWLWFLGYGVQIGGKYCTSTSIFSCRMVMISYLPLITSCKLVITHMTSFTSIKIIFIKW